MPTNRMSGAKSGGSLVTFSIVSFDPPPLEYILQVYLINVNTPGTEAPGVYMRHNLAYLSRSLPQEVWVMHAPVLQ